MTIPTEKQATTWLRALDNLIHRCETYRKWANVQDWQYQWEKEAIFRLRGLLLAAGAHEEDEA